MSVKSYFLLFCLGLIPALGNAGEKTILGLSETVYLPELNLSAAAKLDTGAQTSSLNATDIRRFRRSGESWVEFRLPEADNILVQRPLARISRIKRRSGDIDPSDKSYTTRPVIELDVCMAGRQRTIEINLTDRSSFEYPILIGSEALIRFDAVVDPSLDNASVKARCPADSDVDE